MRGWGLGVGGRLWKRAGGAGAVRAGVGIKWAVGMVEEFGVCLITVETGARKVSALRASTPLELEPWALRPWLPKVMAHSGRGVGAPG